jgi:hypothetical protein
VFAVPGLCWINTLHWADEEEQLYIGCEDRPGLHRYAPSDRGLLDSQLSPELGDVQDLVFGEGAQAGKIYSISLWRSTKLTELDRSTLAILRQVEIGGMHYHLAYSAERGELFASSYYGGGVHVVDANSMRRVGFLRGDFGTREVVVHEGAGLLLASSTYSGYLHIWSLREDSPRRVASLALGGHIKDILVDPVQPRAWTWSQCGIFELDLAGL